MERDAALVRVELRLVIALPFGIHVEEKRTLEYVYWDALGVLVG
jgi:hypothetical protein